METTKLCDRLEELETAEQDKIEKRTQWDEYSESNFDKICQAQVQYEQEGFNQQLTNRMAEL